MINTRTLSRRIVAALVKRGIEVPQEWRLCVCPNGVKPGDVSIRCESCGKWELAYAHIPDLAAPENLHLLLEVADSALLKGGHTLDVWSGIKGGFYAGRLHYWYRYDSTRSLAILAAVCAALGIEVEA